MSIEKLIVAACCRKLSEMSGKEVQSDQITVSETKKEFEGDFTVVTFPLTRYSGKNLEETAQILGNYLQQEVPQIESFNVVKGFLNLKVSHTYWLNFLSSISDQADFGKAPKTGKKIVLEYIGPNTNKPLHLGHVRNMVLGYAVANILEYCGNEVHKVNIYNNRGIAICKSQVAWQRLANGATPASTGMKGDHFVGHYYVEYDRILKEEVEKLVQTGIAKEIAEKKASIYLEAQETLRKWEAGDAEVLRVWNMMNEWVYQGFQQTFDELGIDFEKAYYESDHYLFGKELVMEGMKNGVFEKEADGSVWVDFTAEGLDRKVLVRGDGTSVYITQDMGIAERRYEDYRMDQSIYVVGNEQEYHFKVLKLTMEKLGRPFAAGIFHLSYGMVNLPGGAKLKSREGTKVDADDLIAEVLENAKEQAQQSGKTDGMSDADLNALYRTVSLGALKFFILRVNPKKNILFDPKESIDLHGFTGVFIQYAYTRTRSLLRKAEDQKIALGKLTGKESLTPTETGLIRMMHAFPDAVKEAGNSYDPSTIANYAFALAKEFNRFYDELPILNEADSSLKNLRLVLTDQTGVMLKRSLKLLGIEVPERM